MKGSFVFQLLASGLLVGLKEGLFGYVRRSSIVQ